MRRHFPKFDAAAHEWTNVQGREGLETARLKSIIERHIDAQEVIVEVHRKLGAVLPKQEALAFIGVHLGRGEIRLADRKFTSFVVVAVNGVATAWRNPAP